MYRCHQCEADGKEDKSEPGESNFTEPLDHTTEESSTYKNPHSAEIHHEIADVRFRDRQPVGENKWKCRRRAVEPADGDGVNPDQALRRLPWMGDDAPHRAGAGLRYHLMLAGNRRVVFRFAQINGGEDADENAEDRGSNSRRVVTPPNQHGTDGGSDNGAETGGGGEPAEALGAIVRI